MTIDDLRAHLVRITNGAGAWGANLPTSTPVMVNVNGIHLPVTGVHPAHLPTVHGGFAVVLGTEDVPA